MKYSIALYRIKWTNNIKNVLAKRGLGDQMSDFIRKFKSLREKIFFNQNLRKLQEYEKSAARLPLFIDYCGCE